MARLPSTRSLVILETISRNGTFRAAAEELNTTPSAISHRIADLESELGAPLFSRSGRTVELNPAGREYVREIRKALNVISTSGVRFAKGARSLPVRVALHPPFAHNWLAPRLPRLNEAFPDTRFEFVYAERPSEAFADEVDVAIDWGTEIQCHHKNGNILLPRVVTLIASPDYLETYDGNWTLETLLESRILYCSSTSHEFSLWLSQMGADPSDYDSHFLFSSTALLLAAIKSNLGAGMSCRNLIADDLNSRKLVAPFQHNYVTGDCYYIVKMPRMRDKRLSEAIVAWFTKEAETGLR